MACSRGARVSLWLWILKVKGPARNLHNLIPEVAMITVWGATFGNQWEYCGLPLTSCVIFTKVEILSRTQNNTGCLWQPLIFSLIWKKTLPQTGPPQHSKYTGPLTLQLSPLITHFLKFGSSTTEQFVWWAYMYMSHFLSVCRLDWSHQSTLKKLFKGDLQCTYKN